ncbi:NF-kappa-B inhibitor-like protein 2 isoform 2 [Theobroma cacao]|uniref:NF-kappa-B inhibitor-like protein 2 isoform 2 n=1 Tax=Theobroma cacao TaxID=3641 RepID=A0A061GV50_THECC|nr:NF-kappa-B inhibitor-like protein 2 isoform 2 [Theobroma cacao]
MDTLSALAFITNCSSSPFTRFSPLPRLQTPPLSRRAPTVFVLKTSSHSGSESVEEDVLQMFFKDREVNGDFISKASDMLWQREVLKVVDPDAGQSADIGQQAEQVMGSDDDGGFLKLSRTQEWLLGDNSAPMNKKAIAKLKRELMLLSVGIGTACSGYCLIVLSVQAAVSYAVGVLFSCLYLQLLYQHVDNLSKEMVPPIFLLKKLKKIGIRSEDLQEFFERSIKGSGIALSSPRLVIPAAVYGLWILSHKFLANDFFDFQLTPAMIGMFAYKAAALVQVYRDNEDLQFVFPENEEQSSD